MSHSHTPKPPAPPRRECVRVDSAFLVEIGWLTDLPANNARWFTYGPAPADKKGNPYPDVCDHWIEMQYRDGDETWCPLCATEHRRTRLKRKILQAPHAPPVWHSFYSHATGQEESDRKAFQRHGSDHAKRQSDELGIGHSFTRTDSSEILSTMTGTDRKGRDRDTVVGEALRATHDKAVADGRKAPTEKKIHY